MTNDLAFYMHAGSGNHGCEAIVDSLARMLRNKKILLVTSSIFRNTFSRTRFIT